MSTFKTLSPQHPEDPANKIQVGGDHYRKLKIQTWDYIAANDLNYLEGNVVKYVSRHRNKNGLEDIEKAIHYLQKLREVHYGVPMDQKPS